MADEKKILLSVKVDIEQALKNMGDLKKQIDDIKGKQKELDRSTDDGRKQYEAYGAQIRQLNSSYKEQQRNYDNAIKAEQAQKESLNQLKAQLSLLTAEYNKLSKEQRNSAEGVALKNSIKGISDELKTAEGGIGNFTRNVGDYKNSIKDALGLNSGFAGMLTQTAEGAKEAGTSFGKQGVEGVKSFGKSLLSLLANPIVAIIAGIVAVVMLLYNLFKDFDPIVDKVEQVFASLTAVWNTLKSTAQQLFSGVLSLKQAFSGLGKSMADAAEEAYKLKQAQQDLEDQQRISDVNQKKYKNQIDELMLQSRNRSLDEKDRMALIDKAMKLEKQAYNERKTIADKDYANTVQEAINNSRLTDFEKQQLKSRGINYAVWLENKGKLDKKYTDKIKESQGRQLDVINEGIQFEEKAQNRRDQLQDKAEQKAQQRAEKNRQQAEQDAQKQEEIAQRIANATNELNNIKVQGELNSLKEISDNEKKSYTDRFNAIYAYEEKQKKLIEDNATFESSKKDLTEKEIELIEAKKNQDIENLKKQTDKNIEALNKSHLQETLDDFKKNAEKQKSENSKSYQDELTELVKNYDKGKITSEQYLSEKNKLLKKYEEKDFNQTLDNLQKQINIEGLSEQQKFDIQKAIDEKRLEHQQKVNDEIVNATKERADKEKAIEEKLSEVKKQLYSQLAQTISDIVNGSFESRLQDLDAETQAVSDNATKQKNTIQAKEDAGVISKSQAEKQKKAIDAQAKKDTDKLEAEKKKVTREQAIFNRVVSVFNIGLSTAEAIIKAVAEFPITGGMPFAAIAGGIGALQIASVLAQPLPKASLGMLLRGKSHALGGIPIEAEGGEAIINKRSTSMFTPLLSAINQAGGGVPFVPNSTSIMDGGYSVRTYYDSPQLKDYTIKQAMKEAVQELNISVAVEDIRKEDKKYTNIEQSANF